MWISQCLIPTCCVTEHPACVVSAQRIRGRVYMRAFDSTFNSLKAWPRETKQRCVTVTDTAIITRYFCAVYLFLYLYIALYLTSSEITTSSIRHIYKNSIMWTQPFLLNWLFIRHGWVSYKLQQKTLQMRCSFLSPKFFKTPYLLAT